MTWKELKTFIDNLSNKDLEKEVPIFVFPNGEVELLNGVKRVGEDRQFESHCSDFNEGYFADEFYLFCGRSDP